jgi:hypothetical protein
MATPDGDGTQREGAAVNIVRYGISSTAAR